MNINAVKMERTKGKQKCMSNQQNINDRGFTQFLKIHPANIGKRSKPDKVK